MVGVGGIEPPMTESKSVALTAWLHSSIARLFRAVNQALQILFSPKLHIAGMTFTHSPLAFWTFGFTLCSRQHFNFPTHRGWSIFLFRIIHSAVVGLSRAVTAMLSLLCIEYATLFSCNSHRASYAHRSISYVSYISFKLHRNCRSGRISTDNAFLARKCFVAPNGAEGTS